MNDYGRSKKNESILADINLELEIANEGLSKITEHQELTHEFLNMIVDTFSDKIDSLVQFMESSTLDQLEERREGMRQQVSLLDLMEDVNDKLEEGVDQREHAIEQREDQAQDDGGAGGFIAGATTASLLGGGLKAGLKSLMGFLTKIGRLVRVGGPIGLAIGGILFMLESITDNPAFAETVDTIKKVWTRNITPLFSQIGSILESIRDSGMFQRFLADIRLFKQIFQDVILSNISILVNTIGIIFDGFSELLSGNIVSAGQKIIGGLLRGITGIFDNILTGILRLFGVNFAEGETFLSAVGGFLTDLVMAPINAVKSAIDWIKGLFSFEGVSEAIKGFDLTQLLMDIVTAPFRALESVRDFIGQKISDFAGSLLGFLPGWLKKAVGIDESDESEEDELRSRRDRLQSEPAGVDIAPGDLPIRDVSDVRLARPEQPTGAQQTGAELEAAQAENMETRSAQEGGGQGAPIALNSGNNSSVVNNNAHISQPRPRPSRKPDSASDLFYGAAVAEF